MQIENSLKEYYQIRNINNKFIYSMVLLIRKFIVHYLKEVYMTPMVDVYKGEYIAIDVFYFAILMRMNKFG